MRRADQLTGTVTLLFGTWVALLSSNFPLMRNGVPGPGLIPLLCGVLLAGFGLALLLKPAEAEVLIPWPARNDGARLLGVLGSIALFTALVPYVGFAIATSLFLTGLIWWWGSYSIWRAVFTGLVLAAIMMLIFQVLLGAPLPEGIWG